MTGFPPAVLKFLSLSLLYSLLSFVYSLSFLLTKIWVKGEGLTQAIAGETQSFTVLFSFFLKFFWLNKHTKEIKE